MKKTMWKWKAVLTLLICMVAVSGNRSGYRVQAEEYTYESKSLKYEIVNDEIEITGYTGSPTDIEIPAQIDTENGKMLPVTSIGDSAFSQSKLTSIDIPDNVESIGNNAFEYCRNLSSITFSSDSRLTSIGDRAFLYG